MCQVARFPLDASGNFGQSINQDIFQMRVHILTSNGQSVFQFLFIDAQHLFEEASEENCVTCLVDQLRGGEDAHLFIRHSYYIRAKSIGHTRLTLEKSR